ncbi:hypothetical protein NLI96_g4506 [Meripilus lineatus]|uniref:Mid2 domain-containing protein n=1 Tax=Meripilus lineatus TaxID=2056292 RepID=A0AAD5YEP8_9APHY|nr:hypothetical protein NLI96_g4506 [Physisporinus lineatus]
MRGIHLHFYRAIILLFLARPIRLASAILQTVDDRDPGIQYFNGTWTLDGVDAEYSGTTSHSRNRGGTAIFNFTGTQVAVYGTLGPVGDYVTHSTYTINQGPPNSFTAPNRINKVQYRIQFYMSEQLPNSNHTLTIVNQGDWFYLDYLEVTVPDPIASAHDPMPPNVTGPPSQISQLGSSPSTILSSTESAESSTPNRSSSPSSIMMSSSGSLSSSSILPSESNRATRLSNGVIGGLAVTSIISLLLGLVFVYFYLRRWNTDVEVDPDTHVAAITPFLHTQRHGFPPNSPIGVRSTLQVDTNTASSEATALPSINSTNATDGSFFIQLPRGSENLKVAIDHPRETPVATGTLHNGEITSESTNVVDNFSVHTGSLPPPYSAC